MNLKSLIFVFFILVFSFSVFAEPLSVEFSKNNYFFGETVQGKIFLDDSVDDELKSNDFHISLNDSITNIYPSLIELDEYIYFYFNVPYLSEEGIYDFVVEDLIYEEFGILKEEDQIFNLNFNQASSAVLSISPAFIQLNINENNRFNIEFDNPSSSDAVVDISLLDNFIFSAEDNFLVRSGKVKIVEFYVSPLLTNKNETNIDINYGSLSYFIPVLVEGLVEESESEENVSSEINETEDVEEQGNIVFLQKGFNISIGTNQAESGFVKIVNEFNQSIEIEVILSENLESIIDLEFEKKMFNNFESKKNYIYVNENKNVESGVYEGSLSLSYNDSVYDTIPFIISVFEEEVEDNNTIPPKERPDIEDEKPRDKKFDILIGILIFVLILGFAIFLKYKKEEKRN